MKGPSLQKTAVLSAGLHMMFFLLSFLILRQSHEMVMPSPYTVSLVGPTGETQKRGAAVEPGAAPHVEKNQTTTHTAHIDEKKDLKSIEESIAALKAKQKIKKIVGMRRALISVQGRPGKPTTKSSAQNKTTGSAGGTSEADYEGKITGQIHAYWAIPDFFRSENLEAHINVRIGRDGTLFVEGFEKKSGNRLFDRLALRTIEKASPVTPPTSEMEIMIRFSPKDEIQ